MATILEMREITKAFPGVKALDSVNFKVNKGEIHALCGENGAGKSTLMKVLSGVFPNGTYDGKILINEEEQTFNRIKDSENAGVTIIYQELALAKEMTIAENIFLGNEWKSKGLIDWDRMHIEADKLLKKVGLTIDSSIKVGNLGIGQQQLIEIAKALSKDCEIIIMDEPTAALAEEEVEILIEILHQLREKGITVIYISHKLKEVMSISDQVTILRDGQTISTVMTKDVTENDIISLMVGRELSDLFPYENNATDDIVLELKDFSFINPKTNIPVTENISFKLHKGEVLGIGGLMGAGRTELATSLFGGYDGKTEGSIYIDGKDYHIKDPKEAIEQGLAYVSEDRKRYGLVLGMDVAKNTTMASLNQISSLSFLNQEQEVVETQKYNKKMRVKTPTLETKVVTLSGGNQQKVVLSKWLMSDPKVLILDEPTRGIDVGAKQEIYKLMNELTANGVGIIMISSELPELLGMSDRMLVMADKKVMGEIPKEEANQENILKLATGGEHK
ncbi:xylose ABC transporter ATP-binding protein [Salipaludibacillus sp. HK11]|uniref:xylose ABC transporter ATP-binding protein n=1 Tax=Salipaludibacillus sp. HK11 TaxID=3394320 RepID=UPI0039FD8E26